MILKTLPFSSNRLPKSFRNNNNNSKTTRNNRIGISWVYQSVHVLCSVVEWLTSSSYRAEIHELWVRALSGSQQKINRFWIFGFFFSFLCIFLPKFTKIYTRSLLIEIYRIMKRDNSSPIFDNLNSWTDTLNPQKALKGSKKWPTAPYFKIVLFTTYSNPLSGAGSPVKLKIYSGKCVFYSDP